MPGRLGRGSASAEKSPSPLWLWPPGSAVLAVLAGIVLGRLKPDGDGFLMSLPTGDVPAARALLQARPPQ